MSPEQEKLLTEVELAKLWGVTTSFLQKMRHEGRGAMLHSDRTPSKVSHVRCDPLR